MNRLAVIQISSSDITDELKKNNVIDSLKNSPLFDKIVLAAPNLKDTEKLKSFSQDFDVELFLGDTINVTKRILDCALFYNADTIVRVLSQWFFIDMDLVKKLINFLENENLDYVELPKDFDFRFGADVAKRNFYEKILTIFNNNPELEKKFCFNPWGFAEQHQKYFKTMVFDDVPIYDKNKFDEVQKTMKKLWPDRWEQNDRPIFPYSLAEEYCKKYFQLNTLPKALDLACGVGGGTNFLNKNGFHAFGVDIDEQTIELCKKRYSSNNNLEFFCSDYKNLKFTKDFFDLILSIVTIEHIPDDDDFLQKCHYWLKENGIIVIQAPLLLKRPFLKIENPIQWAHLREYSIESFSNLVSKYFQIEKIFGISRGYYVDIDSARNEIAVIAKKIS